MATLPLNRPCPRCGAQPNQNCKPTGRTIRGMHAERWGRVKTPGTAVAKPADPVVELPPNPPDEPEDLELDALDAMHEHLEPEAEESKDELPEAETPPEE